MKFIIPILLLWVCFNSPVLAEAPKQEVKDLTVKEMIEYYADYYGASEKELSTTFKCESNFNQKAIGDGGKAVGIAQYHKPTFDRFSKLIGENLDYYSVHDQIKLTSYIFAEYPQYRTHWTCFSKHFAVK